MRSSIACFAAISFVVAGCSSAPPEENVATENESALSSSCTCNSDNGNCDPTLCETGIEFALSSLTTNADGSFTLAGYNSKGSFRSTFVSTTAFRAANLNNYIPTDPCRGYASSYNSIVGGSVTDTSVFSPIGDMAGNLCTGQVWLTKDSLSIRAFRPKAP